MRIGELYSHGVHYHKSDVPRNLREFVNYQFSSNIYIEDGFDATQAKIDFETNLREYLNICFASIDL